MRMDRTVRVDGAAQMTLAAPVTLSGIGVHSGAPATITLTPGVADSGIRFVRTDAAGKVTEFVASWRTVVATELATQLGSADGQSLATVEHLMSAFSGLGVDAAVVEIDGPEMPIMDGSADAFVAAIDSVGLVALDAPRQMIEILKPVRIERGDAFAELVPFAGRRFDVTIAFDEAVIGRQALVFDLEPGVYRDQIARARTFGRVSDALKLRAMGFARGSSLENSVALDDGKVVNPEGTRWPDEFVRHKSLDAVGDLALAGLPIRGLYRSFKGGHRMNVEILKALFADPSAFRVIVAPADEDAFDDRAAA